MSLSFYRQFLFQSKGSYHIYIGEGYSGSVAPQQHEFYHCTYITEGQILENQFGKEFLQSAGECFFTPAGTNHSLYIFENTKYFCLSFSKSIADILFSYFQNLRRDFSNLPPIIKLTENMQNRLCLCLRCLLDEQEYDSASAFGTGQFLTISALIIILRDSYSACFPPIPFPTNTKETYAAQIQRCLQHIDTNFDHPLTVDELVQISMLSKSTFYKAFEQYTGMSAKQYLAETRIKKAIQLMSISHIPLNEIARRVGYDDFSTFYRNFIRIKGVSPAQYRNDFVLPALQQE